MKKWSRHVLFGAIASATFVACSSSGGSSGASSGMLSCMGPGQTGAGSATCTSCLQTSCGTQLSTAESSCSAYLSCYQGCSCSDTTCLTGCLSKIDTTCQTPFQNLAVCLGQSCAGPCNQASDAGGNG